MVCYVYVLCSMIRYDGDMISFIVRYKMCNDAVYFFFSLEARNASRWSEQGFVGAERKRNRE